MGIKHMNIFEGEFRFIFEQINTNFSNNSKKISEEIRIKPSTKIPKNIFR